MVQGQKIPAHFEVDILTGRRLLRADGHSTMSDSLDMPSFAEYPAEE